MNELLQSLEHWGADTNGALRRVIGDIQFYEQLLRAFSADPSLQELRTAAEQTHYEEAFRMAHSLKGAAANLGLTPLATALTNIVEDLRAVAREKDAGLGDQERAVLTVDLEVYIETLSEFQTIIRRMPDL